MRIRVSDDTFLPELLAYLRSYVDVVVAQVGPAELAANVLGYGLRGSEVELDLRLRAWESSRPDVTAERVVSPPSLRRVLRADV
jgi:hypothetical protein